VLNVIRRFFKGLVGK